MLCNYRQQQQEGPLTWMPGESKSSKNKNKTKKNITNKKYNTNNFSQLQLNATIIFYFFFNQWLICWSKNNQKQHNTKQRQQLQKKLQIQIQPQGIEKMLTAFLPAAAALLTSTVTITTTTTTYTTTSRVEQHLWSQQLQQTFNIDEQQRQQNLKGSETAFYEELFSASLPATKQRMLPQLELYDNVLTNTTTLETTTYLPAALNDFVLAPPLQTTTTTTAHTPTNISAYEQARPPQPTEFSSSSILMSPTPSALAELAGASTTASGIIFESDLLPAVFINANNNNNSNNNDNSSNSTSSSSNRNTTTLGLGGFDAGNGIDEDDDNLNSFYFYETEQFAVLWILFTIIVLGNSAVLFVMFLNKNRKSRMNYFIKQLALADLCVGLLNVLTDIIWRITISWRAGNIACKLIRFSQVCVTYSSTYVLVAMSIDRYDAITHPMNFSKSWKRARHLVAGAWIISALFSLPILMLYEEKLIQGQKQCWIELGSPWAWQVYMSLVSATLFAFPALIISACYAIIVKTIWAKGSIFVPAERAGFGNNIARRASSRGIIPRAKVKTVKMTFVIVIVFIVCWSPYIIFDLLQVFGHIPQTQTNIAIATFIQSLAPLNSAANPLIYCLFSSTVFRTLSRFPPFKWFTCCCKSYRHNSNQNRCNTVGRRLHNSCDSMRTLTTSLTVSRRSNKGTTRVVICERPKSNSITHNHNHSHNQNAMSEV